MGFRVDREGKPYDLRCQRGKEVRYVEVKGTTTPGTKVLLTSNEVKFARRQAATMDLFVVGGIKVIAGPPVGVSGGRVVHRGLWALNDHMDRLRPTAYEFLLP